jgi:putative transcriptional regulator
MPGSSLKERLEQRARSLGGDQSRSGIPVVLLLRPHRGRVPIRSVDAIKRLADSGLSLRKAKDAVERALETDRAIITVNVQAIPDLKTLARDMIAVGFALFMLRDSPEDKPEVAAIRKRLRFTQTEFAQLFGIDVQTLQGWEQNRRDMPNYAASLLRTIESDPDAVIKTREMPIDDEVDGANSPLPG